MREPSTDTVVFLFTDIEGYTRHWEHAPEAKRQAQARHDALVRGALEDQGGNVFKTIGDAYQAAFPDVSRALLAAVAAQRALAAEDWSAFAGFQAHCGCAWPSTSWSPRRRTATTAPRT